MCASMCAGPSKSPGETTIARDGWRWCSALIAASARSDVSGRGAMTTSVSTLVRIRTRTDRASCPCGSPGADRRSASSRRLGGHVLLRRRLLPRPRSRPRRASRRTARCWSRGRASARSWDPSRASSSLDRSRGRCTSTVRGGLAACSRAAGSACRSLPSSACYIRRQRRPSCSISSSAFSGPHEPAS